MAAIQDAKNLRASPLLHKTLEDFRALIIERWESAVESLPERERAHAGIWTLKEFIELLNDGIDTALGDKRNDDNAEQLGNE
jgi:hypothetical protein